MQRVSRPIGALHRFVRAHWRGEFPLATSLALHYLLPAAAGALVLALLTARMAVDGAGLRVAGLAFLLAWTASLALDLWGAVGAWRSAGLRQRGHPWAARSTRAVVVLFLAAAAATTAFQHLPHAWLSLRLALGTDPAGHAALDRSDGGRRWRLRGHLGVGDASTVAAALADPGNPRHLELDLAGGRRGEAARLAERLAGQGWLTRITGECQNACLTVFMAGDRRQLMPGSLLGFNRSGADHASPLVRWFARRRLAARLAADGWPPNMLLKAISTPATKLWQPEADELASARWLTRPARPLDLELPSLSTAIAADYADALRANPLWTRIEARFPGTQGDALERLLAAHASGADEDGLQAAAQSALVGHLASLVFNAGLESRQAYAQLLAEQIALTPQPDACRRLLAGDSGVRRSLPLALAEREAAWLIDAMIEPIRPALPRRPTAAEREVIGRRLGSSSVVALARLRQPQANDSRACERAAALLGEMLALPPAERKLALRLAFEGF